MKTIHKPQTSKHYQERINLVWLFIQNNLDEKLQLQDFATIHFDRALNAHLQKNVVRHNIHIHYWQIRVLLIFLVITVTKCDFLASNLELTGEIKMNIKAGLISGFVATVVLSILMIAKAKMGVMPELNAIKMLAGMMSASLVMGWIAHFMIGTVVWGILFAVLVKKLPGGTIVSAIIFSTGAWLMMMIGPMPMAGAGLFGTHLGMMAPIATLMLHIIWGFVLGLTYQRLDHQA